MDPSNKQPCCVFDACFVARANGPAEKDEKKTLQARMEVLGKAAVGDTCIAINNKIISEYEKIIKEHRNDAVIQFMDILDRRPEDQVYFSKSSTLSRQNFDKAKKAGFPSHDQHLLEAAITAPAQVIWTVDEPLIQVSAKISRIFSVSISDA